MADTIEFNLVSPERRLATLEASAVQLPGTDGDMTALANHAPTITTLRPGVVSVTAADGSVKKFAVTGGFAEITEKATSVLAEGAYAGEDGDRVRIEAHLEDARKQAAEASGEHKDTAEKLVADFVSLLEDMA